MEHSADYNLDYQTAKCSCGKWEAEYSVENGNPERWLRLQWENHLSIIESDNDLRPDNIPS